jgi:hypothetical protein
MKYTSLLLLPLIFASGLCATANWSGNSVFDVTDTNLTISGDCYLQQNTITISAENADVVVFITADAVLHAQADWQELDVSVTWPYTVTFKIDHNFSLVGVDGLPTEPIYIYVYGDGAVRWDIEEGCTLQFTELNGSGPAQLWHVIQFIGEGPRATPKQIFRVEGQHRIIVGPNSSIGYYLEDCNEWFTQALVESSDYRSSGYPYINMHHEARFLLQIND